MAMNIPIGFRFIPTDEELIGGFLWPRLMGMELPWNGIVEKDIYGDNAEPWKVFSDVVDGWQTKKEGSAIKSSIYAFTTLKNVPNSKRISRRAGGGTWGGQTGPKKIIRSDTGEIIGHSKMFSFERDDKAAPEDFGHWIMHEYSLSGRANGGDLVVCKITNCIKVSAASKKRAAQIDQDQLAVGFKKQKILFPAVEEEGFIVGDQSGQALDVDDDFVQSLIAGLDVEFVGGAGDESWLSAQF
ncbi:NAC domain-containing protein JA2-like [Salvia miltiorrhiza]|uniref:NAC domain-containing protein JA2-like n=1 Tax=Salvia miltiorrhiza TaxID=226208 RepID=UPI0025AD6E15|nr:NAC domain-containing protein JA2-like [Salvia miltiorrhiza]